MNRIKVKSEGIGVIYQKDNVWKILYPFDNCHRVRINYKLEAEDEFTELGEFGKPETTLVLKTSAPDKHSVKGYSFFTLFDMTEDYAHINGVRLKDDWRTNGVLLELNNAIIHVVTTKSRYELKRGTSYVSLGYIGFSVSAVIDLKEGETFSLEANGEPLFHPEAGQSYEIEIDNDCTEEAIQKEVVDREKNNTTDFAMLYNVIEDKVDKAFRVSVIRDRRDMPILDSSANLGLKSLKHTDDTNPAAFEDGKPCHKNQISKIDATFP